jgi:predicted nucleic acid-binding protein
VAAILLDTTVLIDLLRGRPDAERRLRAVRAAGDDVYACAVNVEEIVRGLRPQDAAAAKMLVAGLRTAPLDAAEGWQAGEWRREYAARGQTLPQADCLIAAAAAGVGAKVATGNAKDFPMIDAEDWPAGV